MIGSQFAISENGTLINFPGSVLGSWNHREASCGLIGRAGKKSYLKRTGGTRCPRFHPTASGWQFVNPVKDQDTTSM